MECCICYEKKWVCKTNCQHEICLNCILLLNKVECPICRNTDVDFPNEAIKIIRNKNQQNIQSVPISFQNTTNSVSEPVVLYDSNDYYNPDRYQSQTPQELQNEINREFESWRNYIEIHNSTLLGISIPLEYNESDIDSTDF